MTCSARSSLSAALCLALAVGPTGARAAEAPRPAAAASQDEAKAIFAEAQKAYQLGRFEEAIAKYERVFEITSHPSLLFNLAQCHRQLSNYERAAFFYERYLATAKAPIPNEQLARELLTEMTQKRDEKAAADKAAAEAKAKAEAEAQAERARQEAEAKRLMEKPPEVKPVTQQAWFWVVVGGAAVVVAGTVTAVAVATARGPTPTTLGTIQF
jgi:tetratricopeptide (TPR) repeat protein